MNKDELAVVPVRPALQLLYTSRIEIAAPIQVGTSPYGVRRIIPITGGSFSGSRLSGRVLPGGADWQVIRNDGVAEVEARYTLETEDGAFISITNWGYRHGPPEVISRLSSGERVHPEEYYFRTVPKFETGSPEYAWINGLIAVAAGERQNDEVIITVYEVT
ncbi:MAG: DUF3237 domain-containing protein [Desulfohalobiaceae bacterium]|nr:DUF3237 domain-containing protein [Desulfohalobiaceae bacterium]